MKVALIRLDKIGDLIATLPCDQAPVLKDHQVTWIINKGLGFILNVAEPKRNYFEVTGPQELQAVLEKENFDMAILFHGPVWAVSAMRKAKIKIKVGRRSQWWSFFLFNKSLRQSRSLSEKHEVEYNWDLLHFAFAQKPTTSPPFLKLNPVKNTRLFEKFQLQGNSYFIVHPGMAGSALNWSQGNYSILIEKLINAGTVVITGTKGDDKFLSELKPQWENHPKVRWVQNQLSMDELLSLISTARAVIAPSTGVLHLAASIGTPCVGIYSPILAHSAKRWGPRGENAVAFTPSPETVTALGAARSMDSIKVNQVLDALTKLGGL